VFRSTVDHRFDTQTAETEMVKRYTPLSIRLHFGAASYSALPVFRKTSLA
jgi:hypothetical protein